MIADADANAADVMQTVYNELLKLAIEFVVTMDVGYTDCVVRVASCCRLQYNVMRRRHDFSVIVTIPNSVHMSGVGLCDDFVFTKRLQLDDRPVSVVPAVRLYTRFQLQYYSLALVLSADICTSH